MTGDVEPTPLRAQKRSAPRTRSASPKRDPGSSVKAMRERDAELYAQQQKEEERARMERRKHKALRTAQDAKARENQEVQDIRKELARIKEKKLQMSEKEARSLHGRERELKKMLANLNEKARTKELERKAKQMAMAQKETEQEKQRNRVRQLLEKEKWEREKRKLGANIKPARKPMLGTPPPLASTPGVTPMPSVHADVPSRERRNSLRSD